MKPCSQHRQLILQRAIDTLSPDEQQHLEDHLQNCESCQRYASEMQNVTGALRSLNVPSEIQASNAFLRATANRLAAEQKPFWKRLLPPMPRLTWRVALPIAAVGALTGFVMMFGSAPSNRPVAAVTVPAIQPVTPEPFTQSQYLTAAGKSLEALDQLLTEQALKPSNPSPVFTIASYRSGNFLE